jgi:hypothetical protein
MPSASVWLDAPMFRLAGITARQLGVECGLVAVPYNFTVLTGGDTAPVPDNELTLKTPSRAFSTPVPDGHGRIARGVAEERKGVSQNQ